MASRVAPLRGAVRGRVRASLHLLALTVALVVAVLWTADAQAAATPTAAEDVVTVTASGVGEQTMTADMGGTTAVWFTVSLTDYDLAGESLASEGTCPNGSGLIAGYTQLEVSRDGATWADLSFSGGTQPAEFLSADATAAPRRAYTATGITPRYLRVKAGYLDACSYETTDAGDATTSWELNVYRAVEAAAAIEEAGVGGGGSGEVQVTNFPTEYALTDDAMGYMRVLAIAGWFGFGAILLLAVAPMMWKSFRWWQT